MKPRKPIPRQSRTRARQNQQYARLKAKFLEEHHFCERCNDTIAPRYREVHHYRGRSGRLLCWTPGFRCLCRACHQWVHDHVKDAQKLGLIAGPKDWGVMPK